MFSPSPQLPYPRSLCVVRFPRRAELQAARAAMSASPGSGVHTAEESPRATLLAFALAASTRTWPNSPPRSRFLSPSSANCSTCKRSTNFSRCIGRKRQLLRRVLRGRFHAHSSKHCVPAAGAGRAEPVRSSKTSTADCRSYFYLRRELGSGYLELLQFFLNHRRFLRSEHPERVNKSPAELLTGQPHPHWLEMLGYRRTCRN